VNVCATLPRGALKFKHTFVRFVPVIGQGCLDRRLVYPVIVAAGVGLKRIAPDVKAEAGGGLRIRDYS
jgi:hypothetical protein